jgi:putative DNA primase/helicase
LARQAGYDVYEDLKRNRPARQNGQHHTAPGNSANATDTTGEPTPRFPLTDIGLSDRYETQNRADVRYCYPRNKHIIYTEARWQWDESGLAVARGKQTALSILAEAQNEPDDSRRSALIKFAMASQKRERITAMLALAQPDLAISPDALDRDPNLLNCPNGTVDLRTGELKSHRREDFLTKITGIEYHPDAQAPIFTAMLKRIFRSNPSVIPFGQRAIGYSATGLVREQCVFFAYGRGRNGKTTFIDAVMNVLGDYAAKADPDLLMMRDGSPAHPTNIADLMGSRMAVCSETGDGRRFDESRFKDLSGETRIKARFLYGDFFQIDATWKIWMYSNHRPVVRGTDLGFWRRMKVIPFLETISDDECDPDLPHKLKSEAAGILAWIVRGAVAYHREGLCEPAEVKAAVADYRSQMDSLGTFLAEHCTEGDRISVYSADLYATYSKWCESAGEHAVSQKKLGTNLAERGYVSERCSYSGRMKWLGIGIQAEKNQA